MMENTKKLEYITYLSVVSAIAVVFLHANECFWSFSYERYWITSNFIECLFYYAVPIFFMISGATLMNYPDRYNHKQYFQKRFKKVIIPFLAWNIIVLFYKVLTNRIAFNSVNLIYIINGIFTNSVLGYYWFFTDLFIVYLCIPVFAAVRNNKTVLIYMTILGVLFNSAIPFLNSCMGISIKLCVEFPLVSKYLIYVLLGYLLNRYDYSKYNIYIYIY